MNQRRYALQRIAKGDYLLLSNDARNLWRLTRYTEGPSAGLMDWPRDKQFWAVRLWRRKEIPMQFTLEDDYAEDWIETHSMLSSRQEAINTALECPINEKGS